MPSCAITHTGCLEKIEDNDNNGPTSFAVTKQDFNKLTKSDIVHANVNFIDGGLRVCIPICSTAWDSTELNELMQKMRS